jgi:hypothetical protein
MLRGAGGADRGAKTGRSVSGALQQLLQHRVGALDAVLAAARAGQEGTSKNL